MSGSKDYGQRDSTSHEQVFLRTVRNLLNSPPEKGAKKTPSREAGGKVATGGQPKHLLSGSVSVTSEASPGNAPEQTPRDHGELAHMRKHAPAGRSHKTA
jgi:hypothetical protein